METKQTASDAACAICARLGEFVEIENAQDPADGEEAEVFPPEAQALRVPNEPLEHYYRFKDERLLKCPHCGTYYGYRQWAPGGSEDVLHTYIHESIRRLGFLEAHVELQDALYQAYRRAQEYPGIYGTEYASVQRGVEVEMALLRTRYAEIVDKAIDHIRSKYERSEEVAELLELYSPHRDHSNQVEEARARDRERAAYYAGVLAEYLAYAQGDDLPSSLLTRLVSLLADDVPPVRQIVRDALLHMLDDTKDPQLARGIAQQIVPIAEPLAPRHAELEELVAACHQTRQSLSSAP